jgi:hypothetical protein
MADEGDVSSGGDMRDRMRWSEVEPKSASP